jgi:hypothetical protein
MDFLKPPSILIVLIVIVTVSGCEDENDQLVEMAERHMERQADQNRQMAELHQEVAEGTRQLVAADAAAREELVALQRDVQSERVEVGRQRDLLEEDRRDLAAQRRLDPILAAAITNVALLAARLLPLVLCWYLLRRPVEPADDQSVAEVLLQDLVVDQPLLPPRTENAPSFAFRGGEGTQVLPEDPEQSDAPG